MISTNVAEDAGQYDHPGEGDQYDEDPLKNLPQQHVGGLDAEITMKNLGEDRPHHITQLVEHPCAAKEKDRHGAQQHHNRGNFPAMGNLTFFARLVTLLRCRWFGLVLIVACSHFYLILIVNVLSTHDSRCMSP